MLLNRGYENDKFWGSMKTPCCRYIEHDGDSLGSRIEYIFNIDMRKHILCCIFVAILVFRHKDTLLDKSSNNFRGQLTNHGSKLKNEIMGIASLVQLCFRNGA